MNSKLLLFFITLLFTGCSILSTDLESSSFEANIGSRSFKANAEVYLSDTEMTIVGKKGDWENSENVIFNVVDFDGTAGEYQVRQATYFFRDGNEIAEYAAFDSVTSSVTITRLYEAFDQIKGFFEFEVIVKQPFSEFWEGEKIMIKGNFSASINRLQVAID